MSIQLVNPCGAFTHVEIPLAQRPGLKNGTTVGLFYNSKMNAQALLEDIAGLLSKRVDGLRFAHFRKEASEPANFTEDFLATCDVAIAALADCGSCTSWCIHDAIELEKSGIPVAAICSDEFHALGRSEAEILGIAGLPLVIVPHPMAKRRPNEVTAIAESVLDEVIHVWSTDAATLQAEYVDKVPKQKGRLRYHSLFEGNFNAPEAPTLLTAPDSYDAINTLLYKRGWTDGLPVVPPTEDRVKAMLGDWDKDTLLGLVEPKLGIASAEKVAANAVMAGAKPEHFPILVAAVRAVTQEPLNLKALQTTTHPCTVLMLLNGPIIEAAGINTTYNLMGQGRLANAALGRSLRFALLNIGGATPGVLDRATMGTPAKFTFCFGENAADNPWEPLHVERGFDEGQSTITVAGVEGPQNINDHFGRTGKEILQTIAGTIASVGCNHSYLGGEILLVIGPEHAEVMARDGFSKDDVRQFLLEHAIIPGDHISEAQGQAIARRLPERFLGHDWREGVRMLSGPDDLMLVVAGGPGRHSNFIPSFGNTRSVTLPITDASGAPM